VGEFRDVDLRRDVSGRQTESRGRQTTYQSEDLTTRNCCCDDRHGAEGEPDFEKHFLFGLGDFFVCVCRVVEDVEGSSRETTTGWRFWQMDGSDYFRLVERIVQDVGCGAFDGCGHGGGFSDESATPDLGYGFGGEDGQMPRIDIVEQHRCRTSGGSLQRSVPRLHGQSDQALVGMVGVQ
jgi:hypothetical protein